MPKHVTVSAAAATYVEAGPGPASGVTETATSGILGRAVFGSINLTATATNAATAAIAVETGVGTGVYTTIMNITVGSGLTTGFKKAFCTWVPPGFRYKWTKGGLAGTTETIDIWNFIDFG